MLHGLVMINHACRVWLGAPVGPCMKLFIYGDDTIWLCSEVVDRTPGPDEDE
jgi:hypothetical protein